jgi:hypothetical protein
VARIFAGLASSRYEYDRQSVCIVHSRCGVQCAECKGDNHRFATGCDPQPNSHLKSDTFWQERKTNLCTETKSVEFWKDAEKLVSELD